MITTKMESSGGYQESPCEVNHRDRLNWQRVGRQKLQTQHPMGLSEDTAAAGGGGDKAALH